MAVDYELHDGVALVRLNRPERANSFDGPTGAALGAAFRRAGADDTVGAVVLTGAGDRVFSAGMDLTAFAEARQGPSADGPTSGEAAAAADHSGLELLTRGGFAKAVIAAVNGTAVGGGFELVLACDLVVAAEHARFGLPEVSRGLLAGGGGTELPRRLPLAVALEMGLTGEPIDARRAFELGLVNRVVPAADLIDEALGLARRIAANGPLAVQATKRLMWESIGALPWDRISEVAGPVFASADAVEGATAFSERRAPRWVGR